jgi:cytochrome c-type biogenesis protein CcmF
MFIIVITKSLKFKFNSDIMIGEHLWLGNTGKFLLLLSFFMAIFSGVVYILSTRLKQEDAALRFQKAGKISFLFHAGTLIIACLVLGYMIFNHYFEYAYVWKYSSVQMPLRYTIACFWAGQEGSFLLWGFWQALLGMIVLFAVRDLEPRVMAIIAIAKGVLLTALLGIDFGFYQLGASPFALLRELPENISSGFFKNPDYLSSVTDGIGLNPLLENYWMISHPPALFLGYASALIPFSFALASLWKGEYVQWLRNGIKSSLWAMLTLSFGIIIGGAWAYKSLTFGGFWAWDPVENASLVPLLLMVAGLHFLVIAQKRNHAFGLAYGFIISSYVMVWYATFLTRSGILGQTSVHAFGDNGMTVHLAVIAGLFLLAGICLFAFRYKKLPAKEGKEILLTKDFFMLIGSLVLALSAFQITMTTSIPMWNKLFGLHIAPPVDALKFYNSWQIPYTIIVLLLIAGIQYLNYNKHKVKSILQQIVVAFLLSIVSTILMALFTDYRQPLILFLFFAVILAVSVSITSLFSIKGRSAAPGSVVSHLGFAIFILGILLAFSNSRVITNVNKGAALINVPQRQDGSVLLYRDKPIKLNEYFVVYSKRIVKGSETLYQIDFYRDANIKDKLFTLYPTIKQNEKMGAVFNPSTLNFVEKDVYTFISHAELLGADSEVNVVNETESDKNTKNNKEISSAAINLIDFNLLSRQNIALKQQLQIGKYMISLDSIWLNLKDKAYKDVDIMARLNVVHPSLGRRKIVCVFLKRGDTYNYRDALIDPWGLALRFEMTSDKPNNIELGIYERKTDFIVLKAIIFPWMNVLWFGALLMLSGFILSLYKRMVQPRI